MLWLVEADIPEPVFYATVLLWHYWECGSGGTVPSTRQASIGQDTEPLPMSALPNA